MKINLLAFGIARDILGARQMELELEEGVLVSQWLQDLKANYPKFSGLTSLAIAVNSEYARQDLVLKEGDEVAIIPPVSGG
jgi:molybdopterin converting factor subunit 1